MRHGIWVLVFALCAASPARANDWYVTAGGTGAQDGSNWDNALPTITAGLQKAASGDTIRVWVGIYHERITLKSGVKLSGGYFFGGLWLPFWSILDGDKGGSVVTVAPGAGPDTLMEGLTVSNGTGTMVGRKTYGGGIYCANAKPTLRYDHVTGNEADVGGGLYLSNAAADVSLSHFTNNRAKTGAGIYCENGSPPIYICTFRRNTADDRGGALAATSAPAMMLACNVFEANRATNVGSAVVLNGGTVLNNTFVRNTGAATGALSITGGSVPVVNNIVAFNSTGIAVLESATVSLHHNDAYQNAAGNYVGVPDPTGANGNISKDPALADPLVGDFTPCPGSPVVDHGDDSLVQTGWYDYYLKPRIQGVCADIGAAELTQYAPKALAIRVKPDGNDAYAGADWDHAMRTIQAAVTEGMKAGLEVWVAAGTYNEAVKITNANVMLYGGFAGNETARNQRDPEKNLTILDGQGAYPIADSLITIAGEPNTTHRVDSHTVVDGFTIRNGSGYQSGTSVRYGGNIAIWTATPVISGNVIENGHTLAPDGYGGGLYLENGSNDTDEMPVISCNTFRANESRTGGGLYAAHARVLIRNNVFRQNQASETNGFPGFGGAIGVENTDATITGNVIEDNWTQNSGGGIYCYLRTVVIRDNRILGNISGQFSAGIHCSAEAQILNNVISGNESGTGASAIAVNSTKATVANNVIAKNMAGSYAGGIYSSNSDVNIYSNTFANNQKEAIELAAPTGTHALNVCSNIIKGSPTGISGNVPAPSTLAISNNCFYITTLDYQFVPPGTNDMHSDPRFVHEGADDFRLLPDSPCIDAGMDTVATGDWDLDGQQRLQGAHLDIGAYEGGVAGIPGIPGAISALRIAAGLDAATPAQMATLNAVTTDTSATSIDLRDACRLLRQALGL